MSSIRSENALVDLLVAGFPRSPLQINMTHESDAELLRLDPGCGNLLAVSVDSIEEEIATGLYTDPYTIGWVACMASLSDLAATGATPLGVLMSETLPPDYPPAQLRRLQQGIRDACREAHSFLLGGDTNSGKEIRVTGCAIGLVPGRPLRRVGISPGDILYSTGQLGGGNAYALRKLLGMQGDGPEFRPRARLAEGRILSAFATACMDSSDGLFTTLHELIRLNGIGINLEARWESWLDASAARTAGACWLPPWAMLAGQHGEYELIFALAPDRAHRLRELTDGSGARPVRLGVAAAGTGLRLDIGGRLTHLDLEAILEATDLARTDLTACVRQLRALHDRIMTEPVHRHDSTLCREQDIAV